MSYSMDIPSDVLRDAMRTAEIAAEFVQRIQPTLEIFAQTERGTQEILDSLLSPSNLAAIQIAVDHYDEIRANLSVTWAQINSVSANSMVMNDQSDVVSVLAEEVIRLYPILTKPKVAETAERTIDGLSTETDISWDTDSGFTVPDDALQQFTEVVSAIADSAFGTAVQHPVVAVLNFLVLWYLALHQIDEKLMWNPAINTVTAVLANAAFVELKDTERGSGENDPEP